MLHTIIDVGEFYNLAIFSDVAKLKTSPKFPAIQYSGTSE